MIAVSGAAMAVIRGREVGTVGWPGGGHCGDIAGDKEGDKLFYCGTEGR